MRHLLFGLSAVALLASFTAAEAQNYIPSRNYAGPGVVVNMDVISPDQRPPMLLRPPVNMAAPLNPERVISAPLEPVVKMTAPRKAFKPPALRPVKAVPPVADEPQQAMVKSTINDVLKGSSPLQSENIQSASIAAKPLVTEKPALVPSPVAAPVAPPVSVMSERPVIASSHPTDMLPSERPVNSAPVMPSPVMSAKTAPVAPSVKPAIAPPSYAALDLPAPVAAAPVQSAAPAKDDFEAYRLLFDRNVDALKPSETAVLDKIIGKMNQDPDLRLQMQAYAYGTPDTAAQARRLSLGRALKVRTYLLDKGVPATRLDIRAMGMGSAAMGTSGGNAPADRVDVIFARS